MTAQTERPSQEDPVLAELERYWRSLRPAGALPARSDVNPARIDAALPHAFILERVAPRVGRLRVAGRALCDLLGMEARGMPICAFFRPEAQEDVRAQLARVFDGPALVEMPLVGQRRRWLAPFAARLLLLPLAGPDGRATRALGALVTEDAAARTPVRFVLAADRPLRIEPLLPAGRPHLALLPGGRAHPRAGRPRPRPHLRLVTEEA
jgi:hypothetical protein